MSTAADKWVPAFAGMMGHIENVSGVFAGISFAGIHPALSGGCFIISSAAFIGMFVVSERHMGPKYPNEISRPLPK
jgi:hypothetical protein